MPGFSETYGAQRNEARALFGETKFNLPGRGDINYPNVTGLHMLALVTYWRAEAVRLGRHVELIPDTAHVAKWKRDTQLLNAKSMNFTIVAQVGERFVPGVTAVFWWDLLQDVAQAMNALEATPTRWQIAGEALREAIDDVTRSTPGKLVAILAALALALIFSRAP